MVEFNQERWDDYNAWSMAVHDWAHEHLHDRKHFGAWMDIIRNTFVVQEQLRAQGYWAYADKT
ncbi:hypothetical protein GCM10009696_32730 [Kocuria himachalensis]